MFVVKVFLLHSLVQQLFEFLRILRLFFKFHQPLVPTFHPIPLLVIEIGGHREFPDRGPALPAGFLKGLFGLLHREILPGDIDVLVRPAHDDELIGFCAGETDHIAHVVAPEPRRRGDQQGILDARLHAPDRNGLGVGTAIGGHRHKFVEVFVVQHQGHLRVAKVCLDTEKAFGGVVGLDETQLSGREHLLQLFPVGTQGHAAVGEEFHVGPQLFGRPGPCFLHRHSHQ